jgi:hypothetical protein
MMYANRYMSTPIPSPPYLHYWLPCRGCGQPIPLPDPKNRDESSNQWGSPKDGWSRAFVCVLCGHMHEYLKAKIQEEMRPTRSPWELGGFRCYSIRYRCDAESCGSQVQAYAIADVGISTDQLRERIEGSGRSYLWCANERIGAHMATMPDPQKRLDLQIVECDFHY